MAYLIRLRLDRFTVGPLCEGKQIFYLESALVKNTSGRVCTKTLVGKVSTKNLE